MPNGAAIAWLFVRGDSHLKRPFGGVETKIWLTILVEIAVSRSRLSKALTFVLLVLFVLALGCSESAEKAPESVLKSAMDWAAELPAPEEFSWDDQPNGRPSSTPTPSHRSPRHRARQASS